MASDLPMGCLGNLLVITRNCRPAATYNCSKHENTSFWQDGLGAHFGGVLPRIAKLFGNDNGMCYLGWDTEPRLGWLGKHMRRCWLGAACSYRWPGTNGRRGFFQRGATGWHGLGDDSVMVR